MGTSPHVVNAAIPATSAEVSCDLFELFRKIDMSDKEQKLESGKQEKRKTIEITGQENVSCFPAFLIKPLN